MGCGRGPSLQLFIRHIFAQLLGDALQVLEGDFACLVVVEEPESLQDLLPGILLALRARKGIGTRVQATMRVLCRPSPSSDPEPSPHRASPIPSSRRRHPMGRRMGGRGRGARAGVAYGRAGARGGGGCRVGGGGWRGAARGGARRGAARSGTSRTILAVIICRNSSKSIVPEPSLSMSAIIFLISSFFGSNPSARIATWGGAGSSVHAAPAARREDCGINEEPCRRAWRGAGARAGVGGDGARVCV